MQKQSDGSYSEIGFIKTKNGENIDKIVDKNSNVYFEQGFKTEVSGVPPLTLNSIGKPVIDYRIYGNSVQNGTPSPENPVEVESVGELVTEGENSGKYEIPIIVKSGNNEVRTGIFLEEPLRKIGNYADYIDFKNGNVVRKIGRKAFNGTERWIASTLKIGSFYVFWYDFNEIGVSDKPFYCTHAVYNSDFQSYKYGECYSDPSCSIFITQGKTLEEFRGYLAEKYTAGTPVTVYYPLATSVTEQIQLPQIPTFNGTTIVEVDTEIQPSAMEITYKSRRKNT